MKYQLIGENNYNSNDVFREILINRGVKDIESLLNADLSYLPNPFDFTNMDKGVELIRKAINENQNIGIVCDSDPDGVTSTAIIYKYLKQISNNDIEVFVHKKRVHGIFMDEIEGSLDKLDLLIVPDAGSDNFKQHKELLKHNIQTLIIDHHDVEEFSRYATVINNQLDGIATDLTGAGMSYLLCKALDSILGVDIADDYLDLVALGQISDMSSTKSLEVRAIINKGLSELKNEAFKALFDKQSYSTKGKLNPTTISFYITPLMNSVFRLGSHEDRIDLCYNFCGIKEDYKDMAKRCVSLNNKRKRLGKKIRKSLEIDDNNKILVVEVDNEYGKNGMCRIVGNSLVRDYQRPTLVYYKNDNGRLKGSMSSNIEGFKDKLNSTDLFEFVAGHQKAAGFEIKSDKLDIIQSELNDKFKEYTFENIHDVDFIIPYSHFELGGTDLIEEIVRNQNFYGRDIEEPTIVITDIVLHKKDISLLGKNKNTIKINGDEIEFIKFMTNEDEYNSLTENDYVTLDIMGRCSINEYMGRKTAQILISDYYVVKSNDAKVSDLLDLF